MNKYSSPVIKTLVFVVDFWLVKLAFSITRELGMAHGLPEDQFVSFFLIFSLIWIAAGFLFKIYRIDSVSLMRSLSINLFNTLLIHLLIVVSILTSFNVYRISIPFLFYAYLFSTLLLAGIRIIYKLIWKYIEFSGFDRRNVIIVGATGSGKALYQFFESNREEGYHFKGFFDDSETQTQVHGRLITGKIAAVKSFCISENIDEIYFALPPLTQQKLLEDIARFADDHFIYFRIAPDFSGVVHDRYNVSLINSIPVLTARKEPLGVSINAFLKRLFDIVFSLAVIFFLFPVILPVIALAIRLNSEGPIFFKQLRPGKKNKLFECYKFRTMYVNNSTEIQATKNDSRITPVGKFLRKTSLDELPQFFNVLLGNMSVVGPRPNLISQLEEYSKSIDQYKVRHFVTPGITGYAQVNGFRGETPELDLMAKRIQFDVLYMENWSLALDVKIIFLTVWNMLKGDKKAY